MRFIHSLFCLNSSHFTETLPKYKMNLLTCMICYADHEDILFVQCEGEVSTVPRTSVISQHINSI